MHHVTPLTLAAEDAAFCIAEMTLHTSGKGINAGCYISFHPKTVKEYLTIEHVLHKVQFMASAPYPQRLYLSGNHISKNLFVTNVYASAENSVKESGPHITIFWP